MPFPLRSAQATMAASASGAGSVSGLRIQAPGQPPRSASGRSQALMPPP